MNELKAIELARKAGKDVWIKLMISSHLGYTQAYQLYPLAEFGIWTEDGLLKAPTIVNLLRRRTDF